MRPSIQHILILHGTVLAEVLESTVFQQYERADEGYRLELLTPLRYEGKLLTGTKLWELLRETRQTVQLSENQVPAKNDR